MKYSININQNQYEVEVGEINGGVAKVTVNGQSYDVQLEKQGGQAVAPAVAVVKPSPKPVAAPKPQTPPASSTGSEIITAPIPGMVMEVPVNVGDTVKAGDVVVVIEAMKMENSIVATKNGKVLEVRVGKGSQVATGDVIVVIG